MCSISFSLYSSFSSPHLQYITLWFYSHAHVRGSVCSIMNWIYSSHLAWETKRRVCSLMVCACVSLCEKGQCEYAYIMWEMHIMVLINHDFGPFSFCNHVRNHQGHRLCTVDYRSIVSQSIGTHLFGLSDREIVIKERDGPREREWSLRDERNMRIGSWIRW